MKLLGDANAIAALKALHAKNKDYIKFLVGEAKSNTDLRTTFKGDDGVKYFLRFDPRTGDIEVNA